MPNIEQDNEELKFPRGSDKVRAAPSSSYPKFCRYCGTSLAEAREQGSAFCPNCEHSLARSATSAPTTAATEAIPRVRMAKLPPTPEQTRQSGERYSPALPHGAPSYLEPSDPQIRYKEETYQKRSIAPLILGITGCIFGILAAILAALLGSFGAAFGISNNLGVLAAVAIVGSVIGIAGGAIGKKLGGVLLIIGGIIVLIGVSLFGVLTFLLFIVGGILALRERR
jgi:uncharacterized Zn finger protein (UPF0148 family)